MPKYLFLTVFFIGFYIHARLTAQDLDLFTLSQVEIGKDTMVFVSLSEIDHLSEHLDSLAIPEFSEHHESEAKNFEFLKLNATLRNQFLLRTNISENDQVFIYSYEKNRLVTFTVKDLQIVAHLNPYGADWPYRQDDYMIGFEFALKYLKNFEKYFVNTLVYIGKKNPFVLNQMNPIVWEKIDTKDFSLSEINPNDTAIFYDPYDGIQAKFIAVQTYTYETKYYQFFLQDTRKYHDQNLWARRLFVIDKKTMETVFEKIFYESESATFATLDQQWTGNLIKNKPPVIFGFKWVTFGCPEISYLDRNEKEIQLNCDNRH